jgi:hypothetical protein
MAESTDVKRYLAHWFQLGKKIFLHNGREALLPARLFTGDRYSIEFENCWQKVTDPASGDCYLEGTEQTIQDLLSPRWEVYPCARCELPVPVTVAGQVNLTCPCIDLPNWPNSDLPSPHLPANNGQHLERIRRRLQEPDGRST